MYQGGEDDWQNRGAGPSVCVEFADSGWPPIRGYYSYNYILSGFKHSLFPLCLGWLADK